MTFGARLSPLIFRTFLFVLAILVTMTAAGLRKMPVPAADSLQYLSYARSLFVAGTYAATPAGPLADAKPGREPLYPLFIAALGRLYPPLGADLTRCDPPSEACQTGFRVLPFANALLFAGTALLAAIAAETLGGGRLAAVLAWGYVTFNLQMHKDFKYAISDYLAVFLVALTTVLLIAALRKREKPIWWFFVGLAMALLALSKSSFLPFAIAATMVLTVTGLVGLRHRGVKALLPAVLVASVLGSVNGAWVWRNISLFGVSGDGRGAIALSTREIFDHMTPAEHLAAYLWWLRGPGVGLAKSHLPEEAWKRHEWYAEDGFYIQGQVKRHEARVERLMREGNLSRPVAEEAASKVVLAEILARWPSYLASMPVMFYRGLWFDEFIALGFPLLLFLLSRAFLERRWDLLAALAPGLWSLCIYPAISLNIPRYQFTAVMTLALAAGLGGGRLIQRCRRDKGRLPVNPPIGIER